MATQVAFLNDSAVPTAGVAITGNFCVVVDSGLAALQAQIGGVWYGVTRDNGTDDDTTRNFRINAGQVVKLTALEAAINYRLVSGDGNKATARIFTLA